MGYFYLVIGKTEERVDMLRSILAQMEYQYRVREWDQKGVPFRTYMYVPEIHHITQKPFLERMKVTFSRYVYYSTCMYYA